MRAKTEYNTQDFLNKMTIKVTIKTSMATKIRMWLGIKFFKIGAFIMGSGIEIERKI